MEASALRKAVPGFWAVCGRALEQHILLDTEFDRGRRTGLYLALCNRWVLTSALAASPADTCADCLRISINIAHEADNRAREVAQLARFRCVSRRGRVRHRRGPRHQAEVA
jgi:hypothetical protein